MARIHMTRTVRVALFFLRIYLILLLGLILVKFVLLFSDKETPGSAPANPRDGTEQQKPATN